jgi:protein disulfide isomerase
LEGTDDVEVFLYKRPIAVIGFFNDKADLDVYHDAAADFDLDFGETNSKIASEDWKAPWPTIKMWRDFTTEPATFKGNVRNLTQLKTWIAAEMVPSIVKFENKEQLERLFMGPIAANIFIFLPYGAQEATVLTNACKQAAKSLRGKVHIVTVDAKETVMHDYFSMDADDVPAIRLLSHNLKYEYKGSFDPAHISDGIISFYEKFTNGELSPRLKSEDPLPKDGDCLQVVGSNFESLLMQNKKHVLIWFYAPWCRTCQAMKPVWEKLATLYSVESNVIIAKMDGTKNEAPNLHVRHYPTVYYYKSDDKPRHEEYDGMLEVASLTDFLSERTGSTPHSISKRASMERDEL